MSILDNRVLPRGGGGEFCDIFFSFLSFFFFLIGVLPPARPSHQGISFIGHGKVFFSRCVGVFSFYFSLNLFFFFLEGALQS